MGKGLKVTTPNKGMHSYKSRTRRESLLPATSKLNCGYGSPSAVASETSPLPPTSLSASTYELSLRQHQCARAISSLIGFPNPDSRRWTNLGEGRSLKAVLLM